MSVLSELSELSESNLHGARRRVSASMGRILRALEKRFGHFQPRGRTLRYERAEFRDPKPDHQLLWISPANSPFLDCPKNTLQIMVSTNVWAASAMFVDTPRSLKMALGAASS